MTMLAAQDGKWRWSGSVVFVLALHGTALLLLCSRAVQSPPPVAPAPILMDLTPAPEVTLPLQTRTLPPAHVVATRSLAPIPTLRQDPAAQLPPARRQPARPSPSLPASDATQSDQPARNAPVPRTQAASPSPAAMASWQARLVAHIARFKNFPAAAQRRREQGVVMMRFSMDPAGHVLSAAMVQGSGYADLDAEAQAWVARADPMPPPPDGRGTVDIVLPLRFSLH